MSTNNYLKDLIVIVDNFINNINSSNKDSISYTIEPIIVDDLLNIINYFETNDILITVKNQKDSTLKLTLVKNDDLEQVLLNMRSDLSKKIFNNNLVGYISILDESKEKYNNREEILKDNIIEYVESIINALSYNMKINGKCNIRIGKETENNIDNVVELLSSISSIECFSTSEVNNDNNEEETVWYVRLV